MCHATAVTQRNGIRPSLAGATLAVLLLAAGPSAAAELGPQSVVRQFCQADGNGQRITLPGWAALAPLLRWPYEPAWDTIILITGYNVRGPQPADEHGLTVEVRYDVIGHISPLGFNPEPQLESITYRVQPDEQGNWHILGPLPPPHLFANQVDIDAMRRSLSEGDATFLANSVFVWRMFQSAGWNVPYEVTTDLLSGDAYRAVDDAKPGDLVVYLRDGAPYHVGLLEAANQMVSSTLNAGIARTAVDAFPGEVRYLRLGRVQAAPAAERAEPSALPAPVMRPTPAAPKKQPTVKSATTKGHHPPPATRKKKVKPSGHKHVKPRLKATPKRPKPTPAASKQTD